MATVTNVQDQTSQGVVDFVSTIVAKVPAFILAVLVFGAAILIARIVKAWAQRSILKSGSNEGAMSIVGKTAYIGTIVIGLTVALKILEIDISFIVAAMGFGLGFAMKDILENYFSGVLILVQKPFTVGDIIKAGDYVGKVEEIEARATFIRVFDGQRVIIPNSSMISGPVINYSAFPERRVNIDFSVSYDVNLQKVAELVTKLLKSNPKIMQEPAPWVSIGAFGDSNVDLVAHFWVDRSQANWLKLSTDVKRLIKETFEANNITWSYPVVTLNVNRHDSEDLYTVMDKTIPGSDKPPQEMIIPTNIETSSESGMHVEPVAGNDNMSAQG